jgi:hypothetical protein
MVTVQRNGIQMQIPRKLSHHIPTVPIADSDDCIVKDVVKFYDIDSDEFQLYKHAVEEEYCLNRKAAWEIVGKPKFSLSRRSNEAPSAVELRLMELLQGSEAMPEEILRILKEILVESDVRRLVDMIQDGTAVERVIKYFLKVSAALL